LDDLKGPDALSISDDDAAPGSQIRAAQRGATAATTQEQRQQKAIAREKQLTLSE
jgi:hypothetical protein